MQKPIIKAQNLTISYGSTVVLENINFEVKPKEFVSVIGKSGTGKSSLLNAVARFIDFEGAIQTLGKIGYCFQQNSLFYWMTVAENIGFGIEEEAASKRKDIVTNILKKIGLSNYGHRYPAELSGGQIQRVSLGRALANSPSILLLDEPFSALDLHTREEMIAFLREFIEEWGVSVLNVTHSLDECIFLSDRAFIINDKKIIFEEITLTKPRELDIRYSDEYQYIRNRLTNFLK